jgi:SAM-dependent methyltransferase
MFRVVICLVLTMSVYGSQAEEAFSEIYRTHKWGGGDGYGTSGAGSTLIYTASYCKFLQNFMRDNHIQTVVDLGCGDWAFSHRINWRGIDYKGFDVVPELILRNQKKYETEHIHFYHADGIDFDLPSADLLICKDVLQHLSNEDVAAVLKQLPKFKYCLITNDVGDNEQIRTGDCRGLDLTKPPFNLNGAVVFSFLPKKDKRVFLIIRQDEK